MSERSVPLVGLIGGIGSGKSSVADAAARIVRGVRLDADAVGHRALEQPSIQRRLREAFGPDVFDANGHVNRRALASRVFGDDAQSQKSREALNSIVHPWIRSQHFAAIQQHTAAGDCDVLLLDAAVLLEAGWGDVCDAIVFIDAPLSQRLQRVAQRGWDAAELARREASQLSVEEKRARADFVVENSGSLEAAGRQFTEYLHSHVLTQPAVCS